MLAEPQEKYLFHDSEGERVDIVIKHRTNNIMQEASNQLQYTRAFEGNDLIEDKMFTNSELQQYENHEKIVLSKSKTIFSHQM